ncbi:MAG TPA: CAP domain-containing protein [Longimicrobiaceae bacterium]|nr:CAP domain-containing protein [Longimicrobiaceae bacterium]
MSRFYLAAAPLLAACMATLPAATAPAPGPRSPQDAAAQVAEEVNRHRRSIGCPALQWDERAAAVALAHSEDMRRRGYFAHRSPEGQDMVYRLRTARIAFRQAAENLALDPRGPAEVVRAWLGSPGHRRNLETCELTHHGVGVSGDRWTHLFFTPPLLPGE